MGAGESGFWEVRSYDRSHSSSLTIPSLHLHMIHCKSSDHSFVSPYGDPVFRSAVRLSYMCSSARINLDLCSICVIHVNCN
jgi:hypothetical protein